MTGGLLRKDSGNYYMIRIGDGDIRASYFLFSLSLLLSISIFSTFASAQTEEEMKILQMYFKEKELVVTPTRTPKPISRVAENFSIITSEDIENMNAHTVAEVLERVTGIFVDFAGHDFGSSSLLRIQGSEDRHVLVLLDEVPWNFLNGGNAETNSIPVRIIKRIEIIKGPASSAWGSSLGGVINIVTKDAGNTGKPKGSMSASYGERNTQDYNAEIFGKAGFVGYYLFAGRQDSDGLRNNRYFENNSFYLKFNMPSSANMKLGLATGYSEQYIGFGDFPSGDMTSRGIYRTFFTTASIDAAFTRELSLDVSFHTFKQEYIQTNDVLGMGFLGSAGDTYLNFVFDEKTTGGSSKFVWTNGMHTAVLGVDISHGSLDQTINAGQFLQSIGAPETSTSDPEIDKWAVFANDTIAIGKFSITPGIRYDHNSVTGSFTSPGLGATYSLNEHTILRTSVSRGFTIPPLSFTSGGALFLDPNPSLKQEKVWSYQAGAESRMTDYLWAKITLFHHDMKDAIAKEMYAAGPPTYNDLYLNKGDIKRQGFEFEAESIQFYNISLKAGITYVHKKLSFETDSTEENYAYNIGIKYDDKKFFTVQLFGHYIWWDLDSSAMAKYDTFIWDLNLYKKISSTEKTNTEIFITAHNIFNGSHYTFGDTKNPRRWVEAGVKIRF